MKSVCTLRTTVTTLLLACFFTTASAQNFNISWGETAKMKDDFDDAVSVSGGKSIVLKTTTKRTLFSIGRSKSTVTLLLVDKQMETLKENEIEVEEKENVLTGFEKYGNNVYLTYNAYNKEDKTTSAFALKIDENSLAISQKIILGTYESDSRGDQADISTKLSNDSSKILMFVEGPERKKENKKYYIGVFDNNLKKIWSKSIELPYLDKFIGIYDEDIANDGTVYVAIKHYDKEVSREMVREDGEKVPSYVYKLMVYPPNSKEKEIVFNLDGKFISGTKLIYNKNANTTVAGYYKNKYNGRITGVFYANIDDKLEIKDPKMVQFPEDVIALIDKDGYASKKESDPGLYTGYRINHILNRSNGSVDLVGEYYKLIIRTVYNAQTHTTRTYYQYYYGTILNTNIDKAGKATFTRVPKDQSMTDYNGCLGYYATTYKDKLLLFYNDDKDNLERDLEKAPDDIRKFKNAVLVVATIDAKGNLSRQGIYNNDDEDYVPTPRFFARLSENTYLINAKLLKMFKQRTRYGLVTIK